ncbi:MAG: S8 family serine peptidase [Phycisphaerae bacterium]|nr:S8 family serine peptidase [Phycisphaerae bacterium]
MSRIVIITGLIVGFVVLPQAAQGEPPGADEGKVHRDVYSALERSAEKTVLVEVTLTPVGEKMAVMPEGWRLIAGRQDEVLTKMGPGEFEVMYRPHRPAMMVGHANATGLAKLASDAGVVAVGLGKITSDVHTKLEKSEDDTAFVCIILKATGKEKPAPAKRRAAIKKVQDKVLARLEPGEFKLAWRFETAAMLVGHINAAGLERLATVQAVVMVRPSKTELKVFIKLENSTDGMADVLVNLRPVPGKRPMPLEELKSKAKEIQDRVLSVFEPGEFKGPNQRSIIPSLDGYFNAAGLAKLEAHPDVVGVGVDPGVKLGLLESVPFIYADQVHEALGCTGAGITVAVLDTGIDKNNPDVQGDVAPGAYHYLRWTGGGVGGGAVDGHGHGTHIAAIITSPIGVAPDVKILPIKVFDDAGNSHVRDCVDGINHVVEHQNDYPNLCVINMSLYTPSLYSACPCNDVDDATRRLAAALDEAKACGIVSFAITGNNANCGMIGAPACIGSTAPVAAVYDGSYGIVNYPGICSDPSSQPHHVTCFSNLTSDCDTLAAPGYNITAGGLTDQAGTSMAAAHCSGVAALMYEKCGCEDQLWPEEIVEIMFLTGTSYTPAFPPCSVVPYPTNIDALLAVDFIEVPPSFSCATLGDLNCDVFVDAHDFELFEHCTTGPGGETESGSCGCADCAEETRATGDGDIDMADLAVFQQAFTGPPVGACCHTDGSCTDGTLVECSDAGGLYQGHTTDCATTECPPPPWGACCDVYTGECTIMGEDDCVWANGVYQGDGTDCETTICPIVRYDNTIDPLTTYVSSPTGILADDATLDGAGGGYVRQYTVGLFAGYAGPFDATVSLHSGYPPEGGNLIQGTAFTYYNLPDDGSPVFVSPIVEPSVYIPHTVWIKVDLHGNQNAGWFRAEEAELGFTEDYYARYDPPWNLYWWGGPPNPWAGQWATITCDATRGGSGRDEPAVLPEPSDVLVAPPAQRLPEPIWRDVGTSPSCAENPFSLPRFDYHHRHWEERVPQREGTR